MQPKLSEEKPQRQQWEQVRRSEASQRSDGFMAEDQMSRTSELVSEGQTRPLTPSNSCWMMSELHELVTFAMSILIPQKSWTKPVNRPQLRYSAFKTVSESTKVHGQKKLPFPLPLGVVRPVFALGCFHGAWFGHAVLSASFTAKHEERKAVKTRWGLGADPAGTLFIYWLHRAAVQLWLFARRLRARFPVLSVICSFLTVPLAAVALLGGVMGAGLGGVGGLRRRFPFFLWGLLPPILKKRKKKKKKRPKMFHFLLKKVRSSSGISDLLPHPQFVKDDNISVAPQIWLLLWQTAKRRSQGVPGNSDSLIETKFSEKKINRKLVLNLSGERHLEMPTSTSASVSD